MSNQSAPSDGLSGSSRKVNIAAWALAAFVVVVGAIMLAVTGQRIFILFIVLGVLTGLNVVIYDAFVLKPKLAAARRDDPPSSIRDTEPSGEVP